MSWRVAIIGLLPVLGLVAVLGIGFQHDPRALPDALKGKMAPSFELQTLDGKPVTLDEFRGKPVLINFWSTWCEPCKYEYDLLQQAAKAYGPSVQFLGVVYQDEPANVQAYLRSRLNVYPQLVDPGSELAIAFGLSGVPESYFVDAAGMVKLKYVGVLNSDVIRNNIEPLITQAVQTNNGVKKHQQPTPGVQP